MTTPGPHLPHGFGVVQEPDVVARRRITLILAVTIVIAIVSTACAGMILGARRRALAFHEPASPAVAPPQIAGIHQTPIVLDRHGFWLREQQRRALEAYRFVDRQRGIAQIPIERAMQIVVDQAAQDAGAPR